MLFNTNRMVWESVSFQAEIFRYKTIILFNDSISGIQGWSKNKQNLYYRPFHKTLPRSSVFVLLISVRFYETGCISVLSLDSIRHANCKEGLHYLVLLFEFNRTYNNSLYVKEITVYCNLFAVRTLNSSEQKFIIAKDVYYIIQSVS